MRQTEADEGYSIGTGRSPERPVSFPDVLLYRGRASDGAECLATFDRQTIVLSRPVAGLPCRIRLGVRQYQAVAVIVADGEYTVRLMHRDDGLSIDLAELGTLRDAEEYCERLAGFLHLPSVTMGAGRAAGHAKLATAQSGRAQLTKRRRARFLTRRRTGNVIQLHSLEKHEIIARR
jgi:hypothetical protein